MKYTKTLQLTGALANHGGLVYLINSTNHEALNMSHLVPDGIDSYRQSNWRIDVEVEPTELTDDEKLKADVDTALASSLSAEEIVASLKSRGWEIRKKAK